MKQNYGKHAFIILCSLFLWIGVGTTSATTPESDDQAFRFPLNPRSANVLFAGPLSEVGILPEFASEPGDTVNRATIVRQSRDGQQPSSEVATGTFEISRDEERTQRRARLPVISVVTDTSEEESAGQGSTSAQAAAMAGVLGTGSTDEPYEPDFSLVANGLSHNVMRHHFLDARHYNPAVLLLDGAFNGIHNVLQGVNDHFLEQTFRLDLDEVDLLSQQGRVRYGQSEHWEQTMDFIRDYDLSDQAHMQQVRTRIDLDNYLDYLAFVIWHGDFRWPQDRLDYWRYRADYNEYAPLGQDGRWRWLVYSASRAPDIGDDPGFDAVEMLIAERHPMLFQQWPNELLRNLVQNRQFVHEGINRIADHLNTVLSPEYVVTVLDSLAWSVEQALGEHAADRLSETAMEQWHQELAHTRAFALARADSVRSHLMRHFPTGEQVQLTVHVADPQQGYVRINAAPIHPNAPGVLADPFPFTGTYFSRVPVRLEAVSRPGYEFSHWETVYPMPDSFDPENEVLEVSLSEAVRFTARFTEAPPDESELLHMWVFTSDHLSTGAIDQVEPVFSRVRGAELQFRSATVPYPTEGSEAVNGIMTRVDAPVDLPERWRDEPAWAPLVRRMQGLAVRTPVREGNRQSVVEFELPTRGFRAVEFRFDVARTSSGPRQIRLEYTTGEGEDAWTSEGIERPVRMLYQAWKEVAVDMEDLPEVHDNEALRVRIRFEGDEQFLTRPAGAVHLNNVIMVAEPLRRVPGQGVIAWHDFSVSSEQVVTGSLLRTSVRAENTGLRTYSFETALQVEGREQGRKHLQLAPGASSWLHFYHEADSLGTHVVQLVPEGDLQPPDPVRVQVQSGWSQFRFGAANTGFARSLRAPEQPVGVAWRYGVNDVLRSSPVVLEDALYFGTADGFVYGVDTDTGEALWIAETPAPVFASPAVSGDTLVVGLDDGHVVALNRLTGEELWVVETGARVRGAPRVVADRVYAGYWAEDNSGGVVALRLTDGQPQWRYRIEGGIVGSPAIYNGIVYVGSLDGSLYALRTDERMQTDGVDGATDTRSAERDGESAARTERLLWRTATGAPVVASVSVSNGRVFAGNVPANPEESMVVALDASTGQGLWRRRTGAPVQAAVAAADSLAFVHTRGGLVLAVNVQSGEPVWTRRTAPTQAQGRWEHASPILASETLIVPWSRGNGNGAVYAYDRLSGEELWQIDLGEVEATPAVHNETIYTMVNGLGLVALAHAPPEEEELSGLDDDFRLHQNHPNPFNNRTSIRFALPGEEHVRLEVYNALGQRIALLVDEVRSRGVHEIPFDASGLASGVYIYRLYAGPRTETRRMMLVK